jgi:hypothetical protein
MAEFSPGQERAVKDFISAYRCPTCRRAFDREQIRVAARQDHVWIVSVRCRLCHSQQKYWVALKPNGEETLLQDVIRREVKRLPARRPVTVDDVLDIHEFLKDFDGNFKDLFEE